MAELDLAKILEETSYALDETPTQAENPNYKSGFAAVIGRPNVGKSTLINELLDQKINITSSKPQTTRHRVHGIKSQDDYQIVFVDTPGLHLGSKKAINKYMNQSAKTALSGVDVIVFMLEAGRWTAEDKEVARLLEGNPIPIILVVNKIDKVKDKAQLLPFLQRVGQEVKFTSLIPISAHQRNGLDILEEEILKNFPHQAAIFPEDYVTDRSTKFLVAEIVREKLMRRLGDEVPYGASVEIERMEFNEQEDRWEVNALIYVEREGQRRIVIGEKGEKIKTIGTEARLDINNLLDARTHLELWVKVKDNWSDDQKALASLGYSDI